jgi:hypothetical protein
MPEEKEKPYKLSKDVAEQYEIVGDQVKADFPGFGLIDMRELTIDAAKDLVSKGFPYLKEKAKSAKKTA